MADASSRQLAQIIADLQDRVHKLEQGKRTAQLTNSAITDGELVTTDADGNVTCSWGVQEDGTTATVYAPTLTPPTPTAPVVTAAMAGLDVRWDGLFDGDAVKTADFSHVLLYGSTSGADFDVDAPGREPWHSLTREGSYPAVPLEEGVEVWFKFVAVSLGGARSPASAAASGTPTAVVASEVVDGIIDELALADGAVSRAKIAAAAVGKAQIGDQEIDLSKLADGSVDASKLVLGAVGRDQLASNVSGDLDSALADAAQAIQDAATAQATAEGAIRTYYQPDAPDPGVVDLHVGDLWYDEDNDQANRWNGTEWRLIQDNTIAAALAAAQSAQATADGKITTFFSATAPTAEGVDDLWYDTAHDNKLYHWDGTAWQPVLMGSGAIADGAITNAKLGAAAVLAANLANGSVDATKIVLGSITNPLLANDSVDAAKLANGSVGAPELIDGAVVYGKVAANAIGADAILANAIVAGKIAANAVGANEIIANSITAALIAGDTITAAQIAAGAIGASELAANSVVAGKIAANAVEAVNIVAGAIQAGKLAVNAVQAGNIASGAVTTDKLAALSVTAAKIAVNTITAGQIAAGAITADKLAAQLVLATTIIAGNPTGRRIEITPTGGFAQYDEDGLAISSFGVSNGSDTFITVNGHIGASTETVPVMSVSSTGDVAAQTLTVNDIPTFGGNSLTSIVDNGPGHVVAYAQVLGSGQGTAGISANTEVGWFEITFEADPARLYEIMTTNMVVRGTNVGVRLRYTSDGTTPTTSSDLLSYAGTPADKTVTMTGLAYFPAGTIRLKFFIIAFSGSTGTGNPPQNRIDAPNGALQGVLAWVRDAGPIPAISGNGSVTLTKTWSPTWSRCWDNFGIRNDNQGIIQGNSYNSASGMNYTLVGYNYSNIQSTLAGATVQKVELYVKNTYSFNSDGAWAVLTKHNYTAAPSSVPNDVFSSLVTPEQYKLSKGGARWITLNESVRAAFAANTAKGIGYGNVDYTSRAYTSQWGRITDSTAPLLRITYSK